MGLFGKLWRFIIVISWIAGVILSVFIGLTGMPGILVAIPLGLVSAYMVFKNVKKLAEA